MPRRSVLHRYAAVRTREAAILAGDRQDLARHCPYGRGGSLC
jgi:hypothetical protein